MEIHSPREFWPACQAESLSVSKERRRELLTVHHQGTVDTEKEMWLSSSVQCRQLHYRPRWLLFSGGLKPMSCVEPFSDQPRVSPGSAASNPWIQTSGTFLLPAQLVPYLCNACALSYLGGSLKQVHISNIASATKQISALMNDYHLD